MTDLNAVTAWWATGIVQVVPDRIALCGYPIESLIGRSSFAEVVWLLLRGELPRPFEARLLEAALVAAVDHGPQAPSIAAARMAATCGVGLNNAVATGVNLLGDVHGGVGQQCMELLDAVAADGPDVEPTATKIVAWYRDERRRLPGFGHGFHTRDPRRDPLLGEVARHVGEGLLAGRHLRAAVALETELARRAGRPVPLNVDGATAVVYSELGFPPELGRGLFVLSRSVGILAHAWEESQQGRRIKGPLPPPLLADYTGVAERSVPTRSMFHTKPMPST